MALTIQQLLEFTLKATQTVEEVHFTLTATQAVDFTLYVTQTKDFELKL